MPNQHTKNPLTPEQRFWPRVLHTETCWLWQGSLTHDGYGRFSLNRRRTMVAHRFAHEMVNGPVPDGMTLDHLCRVRHCVRPSHLEVVSMRTNLLRGNTLQARNAAKTHCPQGHAYDLVLKWYDSTQRGCSICRRETVKRYAQKLTQPSPP